MHSPISKSTVDQRWERLLRAFFLFLEWVTWGLKAGMGGGRAAGSDPWRMLEFQLRPESGLLIGYSETAFPLGD